MKVCESVRRSEDDATTAAERGLMMEMRVMFAKPVVEIKYRIVKAM